jgi:hypothetical protein
MLMTTKVITHHRVNRDFAADSGKKICQANSAQIVNAVTNKSMSQNFRGVIIQQKPRWLSGPIAQSPG